MPAIPASVLDRFGVEINTSQDVWRLAAPFTDGAILNWTRFAPSEFKHALQLFFCHAIASYAPIGVMSFWDVTKLVLSVAPSPPRTLADLTLGWWQHVRNELRKKCAEPSLARPRQWFLWMTDNDLPGVDARVADAIDQWRIPGDPKGEAITSRDINEGPLNDREFAAVTQLVRRKQPLSVGQVATALCVELGVNTRHLCLLEERDLHSFKDESQPAGRRFQLDVPRMKKRAAHRQTKRRPVSQFLGALLQQLITENRGRFGGTDDPKRPILCRSKPRGWALHHSLRRRFQWHYSTLSIYTLIVRYSVANELRAPPQTDIIHITPRRLRYTFGCRLAASGAPRKLIAEALDHSDLQHVGVYVEVSGKLAGRLSEAFDAQMGPLIDRFMGRMLRTDSDRAALKDHVCISGRSCRSELLPGIGLCGSSSTCRLHPPLTCYGCDHFRPLPGGPHEASLELAQELRKRYVSSDGSRNQGLIEIDHAIVRIHAAIEAAKRIN